MSVFCDKDFISHSVCTFNVKKCFFKYIYELDYKRIHFVASAVHFQREPAHTLF